ncbi:MAG: hypothetical protein JXR71_04040 [Bacteroidales bacterium]|nr:hypothetical protein [Bacteroidales bacterium]
MKKQIIFFLLMGFFLTGETFAGNALMNQAQHKQTKEKMAGMKKMKMHSADTTQMANKNSIVRKGMINVEALDKNHDGKLYEDVMDWNVISDQPGTCPLCGMKLREMTVQQVKNNLKEHGFKYK